MHWPDVEPDIVGPWRPAAFVLAYLLIALPNAELQMELLQSCNRNLATGGRIYFDFFQPYYKVIYQEALTEYSRFRTPDGTVVGGFKKVSITTPFGKSCLWDPVK